MLEMLVFVSDSPQSYEPSISEDSDAKHYKLMLGVET